MEQTGLVTVFVCVSYTLHWWHGHANITFAITLLLQAALDQTAQAVGGQSSAKAHLTATLQLGQEKVLAVVGGVASSENTRDQHQRMLITKSDELKSVMSKVFPFLESEEEQEVEPSKVEECVAKAKITAMQLRKEVNHSLSIQ